MPAIRSSMGQHHCSPAMYGNTPITSTNKMSGPIISRISGNLSIGMRLQAGCKHRFYQLLKPVCSWLVQVACPNSVQDSELRLLPVVTTSRFSKLLSLFLRSTLIFDRTEFVHWRFLSQSRIFLIAWH